MKSYRSLVESLPPKTVVFAVGKFNPPSTGHEHLIKFVDKLAEQYRADPIIFVSEAQDTKKNPLNIERKLHFLKLMFQEGKFIGTKHDLNKIVESLSQRYKNIIFVTPDGMITESYNQLKETKVQVISTGERNPDDETRFRSAASKGDFAQFRKGTPASLREIDAKRMMNDVREGLGLEAIKEQIKLPVDTLREKYFKGEIYNVGDIVESFSGESLEIVKRGTNHLLVKDTAGQVKSKWIYEVNLRKTNE